MSGTENVDSMSFWDHLDGIAGSFDENCRRGRRSLRSKDCNCKTIKQLI